MHQWKLLDIIDCNTHTKLWKISIQLAVFKTSGKYQIPIEGCAEIEITIYLWENEIIAIKTLELILMLTKTIFHGSQNESRLRRTKVVKERGCTPLNNSSPIKYVIDTTSGIQHFKIFLTIWRVHSQPKQEETNFQRVHFVTTVMNETQWKRRIKMCWWHWVRIEKLNLLVALHQTCTKCLCWLIINWLLFEERVWT